VRFVNLNLNKIMDIGQIFENNFDCYADTWQDNNDTIPPTMVEGDVVMAMTKEAFIKVVKELILPVVSKTK
jgi:hypothetical protein